MSARAFWLAGFVAALATPAFTAGPQAPQTADERRVELSEAATVERVKADVARRQRVDAAAVRTIEAGERTWPDVGLGCNARRGVFEPMPVAGFRIVVEAQGRRFVYHTDRFGRLLRCATPSKPLDPIK